jgi:hypothetical protein
MFPALTWDAFVSHQWRNQMPDKGLAMEGGESARTRPAPPMYPGGNEIDEEEELAVLEALRAKRLFRYYGPNPGPSQAEELEGVRRPCRCVAPCRLGTAVDLRSAGIGGSGR